MGSTVAVEIDAHIANVTLNRPAKKNAVSLEMFAELGEIGNRIAADPAVRAVILSGAGDCFCAGIDTAIFAGNGQGIDAAAMAPQTPSPANLFQRAAYVWREVPVPVICAIRGVAYGAGLQIALGADIRYAAPDARFSIMEAKWGLIPDMAISVTARAVVPLDRLRNRLIRPELWLRRLPWSLASLRQCTTTRWQRRGNRPMRSRPGRQAQYGP